MRAAPWGDAVDISIAGDEEDVEIEFGLREQRMTPPPRHPLFGDGVPSWPATKPVRREKVGRNDPCPCGSGRKYKKCCLNRED